MKEKSRYLILGSDERLWKFDQPVIFLGNWCCSYNRKNIWSNMDFVISSPFSPPLRRSVDYANVRQLEDELFPVLCDLLNSYHNTKYDSRFWKIVLGVWFQRYVDVIYNRVKTLQKCLENNNICGVTLLNSVNYDLAPADSLSAIWLFSDDRWNNALYSRIFNIMGPFDFKIETIDDNVSHGHFSKPTEVRGDRGFKSFFKKMIIMCNSIACFFSKKDTSFIINSYLPKSKELGLNFRLGNVPKIWRNDKYVVKQNTNLLSRKKISEKVDKYGDKEVRDVLRDLLFELMPICYLEGFGEILNMAALKRWPTTPRFIFTSNNYDTDEVFKVWTATKVVNGSEYIIGQHGYMYCVGCNAQRIIDTKISNKFISWGWRDYRSQILPAFIFKTAGKITKNKSTSSGILLIICHYPHRNTFWDESENFINTFTQLKKFIRNLTVQNRSLLTVRFHSEWQRYNWYEKERLKEFSGQINIEEGRASIEKLINKNRLVIHGYDSTGIMETLSMNIPTLAFWSEGLNHLKDDAKPYYELLARCGVIHFNSESLSSKVQDVYQDINSWWYSKDVQFARKAFCDQYAKNCDKPVFKLASLLE